MMAFQGRTFYARDTMISARSSNQRFDTLCGALTVGDAASARLEAGGAWALDFAAKPQLKFNIVERGGCWISFAGKTLRRLDEGDAFLLADAPAFTLASDVSLEAANGSALFAAAPAGVVRYGGDSVALVGGTFHVADADGAFVRITVPAFVHVAATDKASTNVRNIHAVLLDELAHARPGASLVLGRLLDVLLVHMLRANSALERRGSTPADDPRVNRALELIQHEPTRAWTVAELAAAAGCSRSAFASRFVELVGVSPIAYLRRRRMHVAREALRRHGETVAKVAENVGFASESAFRHAYQRAFGCGPRAKARHDE